MNSDKRLWGARFRTPPDPVMMRLSRADRSYFRLAPYDIVSSQAPARQADPQREWAEGYMGPQG